MKINTLICTKLLCLFIFTFSLMLPFISPGQVNISSGSTYSQNFTLGASATATLPTGWRMDKNLNIKSVGAYSSALSATERSAGNNMSSSASNGLYNFAAGDPLIATDRAIGGISSTSGSKTINAYLQLFNNGSNPIPSFTISYNVEKYRNGTNSAGFSMQMYYSTDGSNWTSTGSGFLTSFAGSDTANNGFAIAPNITQSVISQTLGISLPINSYLYLAWNYSVSSGTTTSNAQALGLDDVNIIAGQASSSIIYVGNISSFGDQTINTTSPEKTYKVAGSGLSSNIIIKPPLGFKISKLSGSAYVSFPDSLVLTQTAGIVDSTDIYVVFRPTALQTYSGNISHTSTNAATRNVSVTGNTLTISDPFAFTANPTSDSQVNLSSTANSTSNDIVVVFNASGTFTSPVNGIAPGNLGDNFANATILYKGSASSLPNHMGLNALQTIYYKAFSFDTYFYYSNGKTANATTFNSTPTNNATFFTAEQGLPNSSNIDVLWTDATGSILPDGYLIKASTLGYNSIPNPVNGIEEANSTLTKNILPGTQKNSFTGLTPGTTYYFKIFPYSNSGTLISYKLDGSMPQDYQTTASIPWIEDFETGTKTSYTLANVTCTKGSWAFDDVLMGSLTTDHKFGTQAPRLRNAGGSIYMNFDKPNGADTIKVYHAVYGADAPSSWKLQMSTNQGISWTDLGDSVTSISPTLTPAIFIVKHPGNVRFKIVHLSGGSANRLNIDDIHIGDFGIALTLNSTINPDCNINNNGKITLNAATGGRGNSYHYAIRLPALTGTWSAWQTDTVFNGLIAGIYGLKAKDAADIETKEISVTLAQNRILQLKLFLEGLYTNNFMTEAMEGNSSLPMWGLGIADKIDVELHNETSPFATVFTQTNVDLLTNGTASINTACANNGNYYVAIKNRNHLQTWSALPLPFNSPANTYYDFTTSMIQAYGIDAQKQVPNGKYAFPLGDLDQSGWVDSDDFNVFELDLIIGVVGFTPTDFNGSGWVDSDDFNIFEPNLTIGVTAQYPL